MDTQPTYSKEDFDKVRQNNGKTATYTLFLEHCQPRHREMGYNPLWTLTSTPKEDPVTGKMLPSAYQEYMNSTDEKEAAVRIAGSGVDWRDICKNKWFVEGMARPRYEFSGLRSWREDMLVRDTALAKSALRKAAAKGSIQAMNKLLELAERGYEDSVEEPAGNQPITEAYASDDELVSQAYDKLRVVSSYAK